MTLTPKSDLSIAELSFYVPALLLSLAVCFKQGFTRNAGWLYLCLISLLRLIGASVILYIYTQNDYDSSLIETAAITSAIGISPLLLTLMGILERLHAQMSGGVGYPQNVFRPIHLVGVVGLVLGIVGGSESANVNSDNYDTGRDCAKAATILFLAVYVALGIITVLTVMTKKSYIPSTENKLLIATVCVLPFVFVRLIYSIASGFAGPGSTFYFQSPNVWVQAFMLFAMEAIAVSFYIWAGLLSPKPPTAASYDHNLEAYGAKQAGQDVPYTRQPETRHDRQGPAHGRQQRSLGDYRPSRMIRNAIRDRA